MRVCSLALGLTLLAGCGTPRERDCRVILPRVDEAEASTGIAGNVGRDTSRVLGNQAARSEAAVRWLEGATIATEEVRGGVPLLAEALRRHAAAARRGDAALRAVGFRGVPKATDLSLLTGTASREPPRGVAELATLNQRCGFLLTDPAADHPECTALVNVIAHFLAPGEGISTSAHVADSLTELAAVHSPDAHVEAALRSLEPTVRAAGAILVAVIGETPAAAMIVQLRALTSAMSDARGAAKDVATSAATLRATCQGPSAGAPTQAP